MLEILYATGLRVSELVSLKLSSIIENDLTNLSTQEGLDVSKELKSLNEKYYKKLEATYKHLTPWQVVEIARHPDRPHASDYIKHVFSNFFPLHGDRSFGEDKAILGGLAKLNGNSVMVIGIEKGSTLEERMMHNFGMPNPWGYRKATRLMKLANKFNIPIVTLVDTPGAYPGIEAEERGQGEAIATSIATCLEVEVPLISIIIGEGGSGGALALASGDSTLMLEYSVFSVISPEGCASILWKDNKMAAEAAKNLALTAKDLLKFNIIDKIIKEPLGGAQRDKIKTLESVKLTILNTLQELQALSPKERKKKKHEKILNIGRIF
ncbi:UNVERIFIED_CONTAM: hypothetical protein PYX00_011108 [Menopon gallinae]|uniref:acetyl-CoA carboxytransferase n=1 Tax=Menopon gallinae TaxID=328185 RepID=A0AAW2H677_9NEOP